MILRYTHSKKQILLNPVKGILDHFNFFCLFFLSQIFGNKKYGIIIMHNQPQTLERVCVSFYINM